MRKFRLLAYSALFAMASGLSACGSLDGNTVGTAGGAVLGGVAGHEISDGSKAGTIGGAAVGGVIGSQITR